jgi:hypothetical protein
MDSGDDWSFFAETAKHIWVVKPKHPERILHIRSRNDDAAKLYHMIDDDAQKAFHASSAGDKRGISKGIGHGGTITTRFLEMGIDGIVDWGMGVIHGGEDYQAVFFGREKIAVVDSWDNNSPMAQRDKFIKTTVAAPVNQLSAATAST